VFGLRTNAFYRAATPLKVTFGGAALTATDGYYEVLEPTTARPLAMFDGLATPTPAITVNRFGKGRAIYLATAPQAALLGPLIRSLYADTGIVPGPKTPAGVVARTVEGRTMYVNTTVAPVSVPLARPGRDLIGGRAVAGTVSLAAYDVAPVE